MFEIIIEPMAVIASPLIDCQVLHMLLSADKANGDGGLGAFTSTVGGGPGRGAAWGPGFAPSLCQHSSFSPLPDTFMFTLCLPSVPQESAMLGWPSWTLPSLPTSWLCFLKFSYPYGPSPGIQIHHRGALPPNFQPRCVWLFSGSMPTLGVGTYWGQHAIPCLSPCAQFSPWSHKAWALLRKHCMGLPTAHLPDPGTELPSSHTIHGSPVPPRQSSIQDLPLL